MLFNCIISNPPYNKGLDLKILQDIWELGETIVFVHPSMWLYDKKGNHKLFLDTKKLVKDHVTHAEEIENSNHVFNIQLFQNIFITKFEQNPNPDIVIDLKDIDLHHTSQVFRSLCLKILMYCKKNGSLEDKLVHTNPTELWECGISGIRGHYQNPDLYTFVRKQNPETHIGTSTRYYMKFLFESEIEATNFRDFLKLKLVRFCLSLYKINQHCDSGELKAVPFMCSYNVRWTNDSIAKELELTKEELKYAVMWVPNYYDEDGEQNRYL